MRYRLIAGLGSLVTLFSCTTSEHSHGGRWQEAQLPAVTVTLKQSVEIATVWGTVEAIRAPAIQLLALIRPDPNHVFPITASISGVIIRIESEHHARQGATVALLGTGSKGARQVSVKSEKDGVWHARRHAGQVVSQGDTLGVVEEHGYWLAVGTVSDIDARAIQQGDPASLRFSRGPDSLQAGQVEWIRPPSAATPYWADVAVHFRAPEDVFMSPPGPVSVVVTPVGVGDTVPAVPASAVVQLPPGTAVFIPIGLRVYQVRWITAGPAVGGMVVVRDGVSSGTSVVVSGLGPLVEAAQDSLAAAPNARPR